MSVSIVLVRRSAVTKGVCSGTDSTLLRTARIRATEVLPAGQAAEAERSPSDGTGSTTGVAKPSA